MDKAEAFACKYAGFGTPPTRRDHLENREKCDIYSASLEGYEQAEKDLIEKAVKWLKENAGNYWYDDGYVEADEEFLEDFCKAIKE